MNASSSFRAAALLVLAVAGGWAGERTLLHHHDAAALAPTPGPMPSRALLDSATAPLSGWLTPEVRQVLTREVGGGGAVLILLDSADIRVCEDLGRQLRDLRRRSAATAPMMIVTSSAALERVRAFARRERLGPAAFLALDSGRVIDHAGPIPTPAVVLARGNLAVGVAHTRRFRNVRGRSFADELSADLLAMARSTPPPATRRAR